LVFDSILDGVFGWVGRMGLDGWVWYEVDDFFFSLFSAWVFYSALVERC